MALNLDTSKAFRRPSDLVALVAAVFDAETHDELGWLEWKSGLDLLGAAGRFSLAKPILGMANRMPDAAMSVCEGLGYLVVGAEPGNAPGINPVDPAQLDDGLSPYLGGLKGPVWSPTYVTFQGETVLVVAVEPPQWGDRIHTLRKAYEGHAVGTVFVRKPGKTAPATADDMDLLQERLVAPSTSPFDLGVTFVGDVPVSWFDPSTVDDSIDAWIDERRDDLVASAKQTERVRSRASASDDPALRLARLASRLSFDPFAEQDTRSLSDYVDSVDKWAEHLQSAVKQDRGLLAHYLDQGHGIVRLRVQNRTERNHSDVLLKAHLPGDEVIGFDDRPIPDRLPRPPRPYGEPKKRMDLLAPTFSPRIVDMPYLSGAPQVRSTWVEDGSVMVGWDAGDLRPRHSEESDDIYLFVNSGCESIEGRWEARSKSVDGVVTGDLALPVSTEPVDIGHVLDRAFDSD